MHGYLKEHPGVFDPDAVRILAAAFDKAWKSVQASGAIFDTAAKAESARAILVKQIIAAAKQGERKRDGALIALTQFKSARCQVILSETTRRGTRALQRRP